MAQASQANHLVTGDEDLLVLKKFGNTKIVKMREFLEMTSL
jgi:predicted nucleic acid-binding protein